MATRLATTLAVGTDVNGRETFELQFGANDWRFQLDANTLVSLTVPKGITRAFFSFEAGTSVWVSLNDDSIEPPANDTPVSGSGNLNPVGRYALQAGDILHFITANTTAAVGVMFYA